MDAREAQQVDHHASILAKNKQLESSNEKLKELNEALDGLIYTASHDLKTPVVNLQALLSMFRTVRKQAGKEELEEEILDKLQTSANRFMETISDLLDVSRIEKQFEEDRQVINLAKVIAEIREDASELINQSQAIINLDLGEMPEILFHKRGMKSILQNLITNAMHYAQPNVPPVLTIKSFLRFENLVISIADNGQGIDLKAHGKKMFQMFSRLHENSAGNGVGLYIVRRTMDHIGGEIIVESEPHRGTTFQLVFPKSCMP